VKGDGHVHAHAHAVPAKKAKESDDESARKARKDAPREAKKKTEAREEKTEGWFNNGILLFGNFPYSRTFYNTYKCIS